MKILVRGPALTRTGYGEHCRFVLRSLREYDDVDLFLSPINWGNSSWIWEDSDERKWFEHITRKALIFQQQGGTYDASIQVTIPNEWERYAPVNIGITAGIEATKVSPIWLEKSNLMDKVITISEFAKQSLAHTAYDGVHKQTGQKIVLKCDTPIEVVHYPVKTYEKVDLDLNIPTKFNFLSVAQWGPRKNLENSIKWFVEEFIDNPDVGLVVKTFGRGGSKMDRQGAYNGLSKILADYKNRECKVYLLHGDMSEEELHSLYRHDSIDAFMSLSHGEGFGLPHFEAAYSGLPVIAPNWSGYLDFLCMPKKDKKGRSRIKSHFATVDYDLQPIQKAARWEGVLEKDAMWAFPQQGSFKMKLREVYKDHGRFVKQAKSLQKWVCENFKEEVKMYDMRNAIVSALPDVASSNLGEEIDNLFDSIVEG